MKHRHSTTNPIDSPSAVACKTFLWSFVFFAASMTAHAQFKEVGPPPFTEIVARQKIRTLLENVDPSNHRQTVETITGWLVWYRDLFDEELIAAWQKDTRANLTKVMGELADPRVAAAVVEFSWRQRQQGALIPAYAPMLGDLMERFAESAKPFRDDLLGAGAPLLSQLEAETVCRILIDMPDLRTWRKDALQILPHYRRVAESLLAQDEHGSDHEKSYRAQVWLRDLKSDMPDLGSQQSKPPPPVANGRDASFDAAQPPAPASSAPKRAPLSAASASSAPPPYDGPMSGTLECSGGPIPQGAETVFNLPPVKVQLDYDMKTWDARLAPGNGQTQRLILRNKGTGPQKRCVVHWSVVQQSR
jgi:hypothetical protein